MLSKAKL